MKRPASPYAKGIVAGITAIAAILGVVVAPGELEEVVTGVITLLGMFGVIRVPNEDPPTVLEQLDGEPEEGTRSTLGAKV